MRPVDGTDDISFRITPWPGVVLEEPLVALAEVMGLDGPWVQLRYTDQPPAVVPERAYLYEIRDTDPADAQALIALARQLHGDLVPVRRERWRDVVSPPRGDLQPDPMDAYTHVISGASEALGWGPVHARDLVPRVPAKGSPRPESGAIEERVHLAELAERVWTLRAVTAAVTRQIPVRAARWGRPEANFPSPPPYIRAAWLVGRIGLMLQTFSPHIAVDLAKEQIKEHPRQPSTALEVAALQLHNDLVRDQGWRRCPRCARVFIRQRGRGKYPTTAHRRIDAIYCSSRCAKATAQAAYRQRRKAARFSAGVPATPAPPKGQDQ